MSKEKKIALLSMAPFFILFFLFQILPFIWIVINSFYIEDVGYGLDNFEKILKSKFYKNSFLMSLKISLISSIVSLFIATIGGYSVYKLSTSKISKFFLAFNTMVSNFTGVPLAFAFIILMGSQGVFNVLIRSFFGNEYVINLHSSIGINIVYLYFQIPLAILLMYPAFKLLDEKIKEANLMLGGSSFRYWFKIGLVLLVPALLGVFVILFANAIGAYATIYAMTSGNFNVVPIRIGSLIAGDLTLNPYLASALALFMVVVIVILSTISSLIAKKFNFKA